MKIKNIYKLGSLALLGTALSACTFLDTDPQIIPSDSYYTSETKLQYGLAGVYGVLSSEALYGNYYSLQISNADDLCYFNNYNTIDLEKQYPFEYKEEQVSTVFPSSIFSDIEISVDKSDKNTSTSLYKPDKDFLKKAALGKTTQLDAFSENKFAIIHTKKTAGIENKIRNQNHDVLDTLAVNGVMKSPDTKKPLSIYRLVRKLEKFDKFDIVFIHPSYEVRCMNAEYPCEQIIPAYKINEGEILAVVYRYIVVYFFGYCSIFTDSMLEWRYYI